MPGGAQIQHEPNDKIRAKVSALTSFGITQEEISKYLEISVETLKKYYQYELDNSQLDANAQVAAKLFKKATKNEDLSAIIFWLKTRARWRTADKDDDRKKDSIIEALLEKLVQEKK